MDALMAIRKGDVAATPDGPDDTRLSDEETRKLAERKARRERSLQIAEQRRQAEEAEPVEEASARSDVATDNPIPTPPFWGDRVVKGIALADYAALLDERATFMGQWGLRGARGGKGPSYEELVETEGRPRLRYWLDRFQTEGILEAAVVYGYFPCVSKGDDLIVLDASGTERTRFTFPRQRRERRLCLADFFRAEDSGETDVVAFTVVTVGDKVSEFTHTLFEANAYRDYLEVHGLSVQLTEALAEYWHRRIREELVLPAGDGRRRGSGRRRGLLQAGLPRRSVLARLRRVPGSRGPGEDRRPAPTRAHRRRAVRGIPAAPRAVDRRHRRAPPGGEVLQHVTAIRPRPPSFQRPRPRAAGEEVSCPDTPLALREAGQPNKRDGEVNEQAPGENSEGDPGGEDCEPLGNRDQEEHGRE